MDTENGGTQKLEVKTEDDNLPEETQQNNQLWSLEINACAAKNRLLVSFTVMS